MNTFSKRILTTFLLPLISQSGFTKSKGKTSDTVPTYVTIMNKELGFKFQCPREFVHPKFMKDHKKPEHKDSVYACSLEIEKLDMAFEKAAVNNLFKKDKDGKWTFVNLEDVTTEIFTKTAHAVTSAVLEQCGYGEGAAAGHGGFMSLNAVISSGNRSFIISNLGPKCGSDDSEMMEDDFVAVLKSFEFL